MYYTSLQIIPSFLLALVILNLTAHSVFVKLVFYNKLYQTNTVILSLVILNLVVVFVYLTDPK